MAEKLNHVFFKNPQDGVVTFKQRARFGKNTNKEEEDEEVVDYTAKQESFELSRVNFVRERDRRYQRRNAALNVPAYQDYIQVEFHNTFDLAEFGPRYRKDFGLSVVSLSDLNTVVLFAIVDKERFQRFESEIDLFVKNEDPAQQVNYNRNIIFIKSYDFFSTDKAIKFDQVKPHLVIHLVDNVEIFQNVINPVEERLVSYLGERGIEYYADFQAGKVELMNVGGETIQEIADNFDIIQSINAMEAGIVQPNRFNMPERSFGFNITNAAEDLPVIGIIDTGISNQNPLADLIINDPDFDLTGTSPVLDEVNHGTAVGALAALGTRLIPDHIGDFQADAKLLPIKILNIGSAPIAELEVIRLIRDAQETYGVQIFTLTICYLEPKKYNETISDYAYALDQLAYELNILIFISIGNIHNLMDPGSLRARPVQYPLHFENESTNLFPPAESMNNLTVGSLADNLEDNTMARVSPPGIVPAIYSRTFHIDWNHASINRTKLNTKLFKPDVCHFGGDLDQGLDPSNTGLKVLSAAVGMYFDRHAGTSFATPLVANLAAKIVRRYPQLADNMQTIKALIINSAYCDERKDIFRHPITKQTHVHGHGLPDPEICEFSTKDRITFVLDDEITPGDIKSFPIELPEYLLDLDRTNSLVSVDATLCFKFEPVKNNQVAYCPVQVAFGIFRNLPLEEYEMDENGDLKKIDDKPVSLGINDNKTEQFVFSESWSQDYYYKAKMLTNTQKVHFTISKKVLIEENRIFKIAVNSKVHKMLNVADAAKYDRSQPFSLVVTINENPVKKTYSGRLYEEMIAINTLEAIVVVDDLEADV